MTDAQNFRTRPTSSTRSGHRSPLTTTYQDLPNLTTADHLDQIGPPMTNAKNFRIRPTSSTRSGRRLPLTKTYQN